MESGNIEKVSTPICEWITLFDPENHPGLSLTDRESLLLSQAKSITENHPEPKFASVLHQVLKDNPLSCVYDPDDDETEVQFICKAYFSTRCAQQTFYCVEYDSSLLFWIEL